MGHEPGKMLCEITHHAVLSGRPAQFHLDRRTGSTSNSSELDDCDE